MKDRIIEIVELGQPQSLIQRERAPVTELIKTDLLIEELNEQLRYNVTKFDDMIELDLKHHSPTDANNLLADSKKCGVKYNLTFWQKLELIPIRLMWLAADDDKRKSWHEVKKGMEKHEHKFTKPFTQQGYKFLQCEHEGCTLCEPVD